MKDIRWANLTKVLERYAEAFIKNAQQNLYDKDINATGELQRSMELDKITIEDGKMSVTISLVDYWYYVENGTKGEDDGESRKMPPIAPIMTWIESKPVPPKVEGLTVKQRAFAIAKSIQKHGTKPHPFFNKAIKLTEKDFRDDIAEAVDMDVAAYIEEELVPRMKKVFS